MMENENIDRSVSRRDALKLFGAGLAAILLHPQISYAEETESGDLAIAMLYDATKCIGCRACESACAAVWSARQSQPPQEEGRPYDLTPYDRTVIKQYREGDKMSFRKYQCMHCEHPACVSVCPVRALHKLDYGPVVYDAHKCIGCRYCMVACPFHVPRIDWCDPLPEISKCDFCADRILDRHIPACAEACTMGALTFGKRDQILLEAHARIDQNPELYNGHLYGESETGGTSWMYLASVPFESLGFPSLGGSPITKTSEVVATYGTPGALVVVGAMLGGVHWMSKRWSINPEGNPEHHEEAHP